MPRPPDDYIARANRRSDLHTEATKTAQLLNGGGVLAQLTFAAQVAMGAPSTRPLLAYLTWSIFLMVAGLLVAAPISHLRYEASRLYDNEETKTKGRTIGLIHRCLFGASIVLFAAGALVALAGLRWVARQP